MLQIRSLRVDKAGKTICHVPELKVGRGDRVGVIGPTAVARQLCCVW